MSYVNPTCQNCGRALKRKTDMEAIAAEIDFREKLKNAPGGPTLAEANMARIEICQVCVEELKKGRGESS